MTAATPPTRTVWRRWWFHLGALIVLVPLTYLKPYIAEQEMLLSAADEGMRSVAVTVGPWPMTLQETAAEEPYWHPGEGLEKPFRILPCAECVRQIRAVFISLKRPGSTEYGAEGEGNPYRSTAPMKIGRAAAPDDLVWITVEGWDGSLHQATIPLGEASPITVAWLKARGKAE